MYKNAATQLTSLVTFEGLGLRGNCVNLITQK